MEQASLAAPVLFCGVEMGRLKALEARPLELNLPPFVLQLLTASPQSAMTHSVQHEVNMFQRGRGELSKKVTAHDVMIEDLS